MTEVQVDDRVVARNRRAHDAVVYGCRICRDTSVCLPCVRRSEFVVGWIVGTSQLERKNHPSLAGNSLPVALQKGSDIMRVDVRLQM